MSRTRHPAIEKFAGFSQKDSELMQRSLQKLFDDEPHGMSELDGMDMLKIL